MSTTEGIWMVNFTIPLQKLKVLMLEPSVRRILMHVFSCYYNYVLGSDLVLLHYLR